MPDIFRFVTNSVALNKILLVTEAKSLPPKRGGGFVDYVLVFRYFPTNTNRKYRPI